MGGGILQDALSEVEVAKKAEELLHAPVPQIKLRCQKCQALNDEHAKFCNQCGSAI
jgi:rRNA maturation endonuclease Nob1